jgi:quinohemoprotein ethanol dehydrogenase
MGIAGAPITYLASGRQYVTVIAGWGASGAGFMGTLAAQMGWVSRIHTQRVVTFALNGQAQLPKDLPPRQTVTPIDDPNFRVDVAKADEGGVLYTNTCSACHGAGAVAAGYAPDLRASAVPLVESAFEHIVREGGLLQQGMPSYAELSDVELEQLRHYIRTRARADLHHE